MMGEKEIGVVSTYFNHVGVAAIKLSNKLKVGNKIRIKGHTTDLTQEVQSMQVESEEIEAAKKGDHIGIKVDERVRPNDKVFIVE